MEPTFEKGRMIVRGLKAFSLSQCLDSGQAFRWKPCGGSDAGADAWMGVALGRVVTAKQRDDTLTLCGVDKQDAPDFIRYFDLERDYMGLQRMFWDDPFLREGITYASGLRVLRQPPFETLITFIISANNNVGRIKRIVDQLCACFGKPLGEEFDFPTPQALASADEAALLECGAGYRAPFIKGAAHMVADGFDFEQTANMPFEQARKALTALPGVGLKVADCVALYGMAFTQAFPYDVWMRRVLCGVYGFTGKSDTAMQEFVDQKFGVYAGIAQQYLFHYARHHKDALCT